MNVSAKGAEATSAHSASTSDGVAIGHRAQRRGGRHEVHLPAQVTGHHEVEEVGMVEQVLHEGTLARTTEPGHPVLDVGDEALACLLAVVADVDAGLHLRGDHLGGGLLHRPLQLGRVDVLAPAAPAVQLGQGAGPGQAPGVGGEEPLLAVQHGPAYPAPAPAPAPRARARARARGGARARAGADADELDAHPVGVDQACHGDSARGRGLVDAAGRAEPERAQPVEHGLDVDVERQQEEARSCPRPIGRPIGRPTGTAPSAGAPAGPRAPTGPWPSKTTSSTTPASGCRRSPRKTERSVFDGASKRVRQSPSKTWSMRTSRPRPSR